MMSLVLPSWDSLAALAFTDDAAQLVAANSSDVMVFDLRKKGAARKLVGAHHDHGARQLLVHGDVVFALPSSHWGLAQWELATGRYRGRVEARPPAASFAFGPDQKSLWVASGSNLEAFDTTTGAALFDPKRRRPIAKIAAVSRSDELAGVVVSTRGAVLFWSDRAWGIAPDGKAVAARGKGETMGGGILDADTGYLLIGDGIIPVALGGGALGKAHPLGSLGVASCASTTGGRVFVATEQALFTLSWDGKKFVRTVTHPLTNVVGLACSPDGEHLAVAIAEEARTVIRLGDRGGVRLSAPLRPAKPRRAPELPPLSKNEPLWGVPSEKWTDENHVDYREYVANEHLMRGMPIVELHRNHGIALTAVRAWIRLVREGGRTALESDLRAKRRGRAGRGAR